MKICIKQMNQNKNSNQTIHVQGCQGLKGQGSKVTTWQTDQCVAIFY